MVRIPQTFWNKWSKDERFAGQFKSCIESLEKELNYETIETLDETHHAQPNGQTPGKRKKDDPNLESPAKKMKPAELAEHFLDIKDVSGSPVLKLAISLPKVGACQMLVYGDEPERQVFLFNHGDVDLNFKQGIPLLGYGKIKWRFANDDSDIQEREIKYMLCSNKDVVLQDCKDMMMLQDVIEQQRKTKPLCKIAYYKMEEQHGTCGAQLHAQNAMHCDCCAQFGYKTKLKEMHSMILLKMQ